MTKTQKIIWLLLALAAVVLIVIIGRLNTKTEALEREELNTTQRVDELNTQLRKLHESQADLQSLIDAGLLSPDAGK